MATGSDRMRLIDALRRVQLMSSECIVSVIAAGLAPRGR
jgi:hypothetical protein